MANGSLASSIAISAPTIIASDRLYEIAIDVDRRYLQMSLLGLFDRAQSEEFANEVESAIAQLRRGGVALGTIRTMVDSSTIGVMPQESVLVLQELTQHHGPASERIAILLSGMLAKLQLQRATPQGMLASFFDRTEALAWLFADRSRDVDVRHSISPSSV